jgi:hypothetical protein
MSDLLSHDVLVISQKAKIIETMDEYRVFDDAGNVIGTIREVEQSKTNRAVRLFSGVDQFLTHKLGVFDSDGRQVLMLERPAKLMKSRIKVSDAEGIERRRDPPGQRRRPEALRARRQGGRADRLDRRRELAGLGLHHPRRKRRGGRADHEEVGGDPEGGVHDRGHIRPSYRSGGLVRPPAVDVRVGGRPGRGAEAGRHRGMGVRRRRLASPGVDVRARSEEQANERSRTEARRREGGWGR